MRGGAIPLLAWAALLVVLLTINWIWTGDAIQVTTFAFAGLVIVGSAIAVVILSRREALRRGAPPSSPQLEAVPRASLASVLVALSVAMMVFGLAFGRFLIYFGAGLLIVSLGMAARELVAERRQRRRWLQRERR
jgi:Na+/H+-translocating membrane pyrophosphatase